MPIRVQTLSVPLGWACALGFLAALSLGACGKRNTQNPDEGVACGEHDTCPPGQICCNPSCGICVEEGGTCTRQICE